MSYHFATHCDACGGHIENAKHNSIEVRDNRPGGLLRTYHPECYEPQEQFELEGPPA